MNSVYLTATLYFADLMLAGFHEKLIPVYLHSNEARKPTSKRIARLFLKRCIVTLRMYQPCFAVYIELTVIMFNIFKRKRSADAAPIAAGVGAPDVKIVCGVDTYHFPTDFVDQPHLQWMGSNYVETIVNKVSAGLIKQEPGTQVIAMQCLQAPELSTRVSGIDDSTIEMTVKIPIQILLKNNQNAHWRLNGQAIFQQPFNSGEAKSGKFTFDIQQAEEVQ